MLLFLISLLLPLQALASSSEVVINEVAWMGTIESANDEWLELKNNTDQAIDLTGWTLQAQDGTPNISLTGTILPQGYFLLERTDDESVPNIAADQIYTGALGNNGEVLELRDSSTTLIDSVITTDSWPYGDNSTKQTMERTATDWQTSATPGGTPKEQNSLGTEEIPPIEEEPPVENNPPTDQPAAQPSGGSPQKKVNRPPVAQAGLNIVALIDQTITFDASLSTDPDNDSLSYFWNFGDGTTDDQEKTAHTYTFPGQYIVTLVVSDNEFYNSATIFVNILNYSVIVSEFMPTSADSSKDNSWIELYNQSDQMANLSGWQLDDHATGSTPFVFASQTLIGPHQYLVIKDTVSGLILGSHQDQLRLLYPDGTLASQIDYDAQDKKDQSVSFDGHNYLWTFTPSPGLANIINTNISSSDLSPKITQANTKAYEKPLNLALANQLKVQVNGQPEPPIDDPADSPAKGAELCTIDGVCAGIPNIAEVEKTENKSALVLILSIIISASLLASWILIILRKRSVEREL